jgi:hypothetical protein
MDKKSSEEEDERDGIAWKNLEMTYAEANDPVQAHLPHFLDVLVRRKEQLALAAISSSRTTDWPS